MNLVNGPETRRLQTAIGAAELRQKVIANNIANVDTPYFKRSDVVFEDALAQEMAGDTQTLALKRTNSRHIGNGGGGTENGPAIVTDSTSVMNNNDNNVDIDREMSLLAKNQLFYNTYIQQMNHELKMTRMAIDGRA